MPPINVVKTVEHSKQDLKEIEDYAKNKIKTFSTELMPVARHLATGVVANVGVIKAMGGTEYKQAIGAAITSSVASTVLENQFNITHPLPKIVVGAACYTGAVMMSSDNVPLQEAVVMGIGTNILSEIICNYL